MFLLAVVPAFVAASWSAGLLALAGLHREALADAWWFVYGFCGLYCLGVVLPSATMMRPGRPVEWWRLGLQHGLLAFLVAAFVVLFPFKGLLPFRAFVDIAFLMLAAAVPVGVVSSELCRRFWPSR